MEANVKPISAAEVESQLDYVRRAQAAPDEPARAAVLAEQILAFAHRALLVWSELVTLAPDEQKPFFAATLDEATSLYGAWMKGTRLTDNPAEAERRALAGLAMLQERPDLRQMHHFAVLAILALEEGHPRRDTELTRRCILDELAWLQAQDEAGAETSSAAVAGALQIAYNERYASDEQLLAWEAWVAKTAPRLEPNAAVQLWGAVEGYCVERFDRGANPPWLAEARRVRALIEALEVDPEARAQSLIRAVRLYTHEDDQRPIAELYRRALETGGLQPHAAQRVAAMEARVRARYGEPDRIVELLAPRLAEYELDYVTAIRDVDRDDAGERCAEANALLAFALALLGRWREAVETIERGKCLRQRHTLALRDTPEAGQLLAIEGELYALSRGLAPAHATPAVEQVRDWFAHGLSPEAQLREAWRALLPKIGQRREAALTLPGIAGGLRDGEAALSLGLWWTGLMMALLVAGRDEPAWTALRDDVAQAQVIEWLAGGEGADEAFLLALERGVDAVDPRPALERMLAQLDAVIGQPVAAAMRELKLSRLVVLPHNFLRLAPLWALPSWSGLEVRMLPGGFALVDTTVPALGRRALLAADPTLDLPLAATEAVVASGRLEAAGFTTQRIEGADATEAALAGSLAQASLLHFAGHGIASLTNGSMSALLTHLVWDDTRLDGPDALLALADAPGENPRLSIDQEEGSPRRKLYYEYAKSGTLFAEVEDGTVLLAGELWRVGDILVQGTLQGCGLAFLCACSSGLGAIERLEEASGLPAALQVAGVGCVIGTGWPVADEITLLFADEFYARLLAGAVPGATLAVAAAVRGAAEALRTMAREEAAQRALALAERAPDKAARLRLRVFAKRLAQGPALPFAHPFDTGAFFVTGAAHLRLEATA